MTVFGSTIAAAYASTGPVIEVGQGVHDGAVVHEARVQLPLKMISRHGLITGATGTGKTNTLQILAEQLSAAGVPVLVADVKGDVSGISVQGAQDGSAAARAADLGIPFTSSGYPFLTILSVNGVPTPVVHTRLRPPTSRMAPADDIDAAARSSPLWVKYVNADRQTERA